MLVLAISALSSPNQGSPLKCAASAQGTIVSLDQTQASVFSSLMTVEVDEGYPSIVTLNIDSTLIAIIFDGVGQMNPNTSGT